MPLASRLSRGFYARPCREVARDLVGMVLIHALPDGTRLAGRLVEVEAYVGDGRDPGSHAHRGPTPRNRAMFGPPGRLYVYRSYGIHICVNVVCEEAGRAAAVLLRAVEPLAGLDRMRALRGLSSDAPARELASGPGRLAQAFAIGMDHYAADVVRGPIRIRRPARGAPPPKIVATPRVGLSAGADLPYRYVDAASRFTSRPLPRAARRTRRELC